MTTYVKTITFGPTSGDKSTTPDKVDPLINEVIEKIQNEGGKILDVKIALSPLTPGNSISVYLISYDAPKPVF